MVIGLNLINENMNKKCFDMVVDEFLYRLNEKDLVIMDGEDDVSVECWADTQEKEKAYTPVYYFALSDEYRRTDLDDILCCINDRVPEYSNTSCEFKIKVKLVNTSNTVGLYRVKCNLNTANGKFKTTLTVGK